MDSRSSQRTYLDLTTPHVADACMRLGIPIRVAPSELRGLWSPIHIAGRAFPVRHYGSVDVFLEAVNSALPGDVLLVDNGARMDESCVGDLVALEVAKAGLSGIVIWGLHRDTRELTTIRLPIFSLGALPAGPQRIDIQEPCAFESARCGDHSITQEDFLLGDEDGIIFIPLDRAAEVAELASSIRDTERIQATRMQMGTSLREQCKFTEFQDARRVNPTLTFRQHLRTVGGAIEE
nr:RraA family protein [uncultured Holophaga sp.]